MTAVVEVGIDGMPAKRSMQFTRLSVHLHQVPSTKCLTYYQWFQDTQREIARTMMSRCFLNDFI